MSSGETDVAATARPKKSSASITELELAFAQDPQSSAYVPLCEAYLDQSRFMEAMVVAKKGLKAHPSSVDARLLLASVYARQQLVDFQDVGYGSAAATMLFLIIALITAVYLTVARVGRED